MPEDKEKKRLYNATKRREGREARRDAENPRRVQARLERHRQNEELARRDAAAAAAAAAGEAGETSDCAEETIGGYEVKACLSAEERAGLDAAAAETAQLVRVRSTYLLEKARLAAMKCRETYTGDALITLLRQAAMPSSASRREWSIGGEERERMDSEDEDEPTDPDAETEDEVTEGGGDDDSESGRMDTTTDGAVDPCVEGHPGEGDEADTDGACSAAASHVDDELGGDDESSADEPVDNAYEAAMGLVAFRDDDPRQTDIENAVRALQHQRMDVTGIIRAARYIHQTTQATANSAAADAAAAAAAATLGECTAPLVTRGTSEGPTATTPPPQTRAGKRGTAQRAVLATDAVVRRSSRGPPAPTDVTKRDVREYLMSGNTEILRVTDILHAHKTEEAQTDYLLSNIPAVQVAYLQGMRATFEVLTAFITRTGVWSLNLGEIRFTVDELTVLEECIKKSQVTHMFMQDETLTDCDKDMRRRGWKIGRWKMRFRDAIRLNRKKHRRYLLAVGAEKQNAVIRQAKKNWFNPLQHDENKATDAIMKSTRVSGPSVSAAAAAAGGGTGDDGDVATESDDDCDSDSGDAAQRRALLLRIVQHKVLPQLAAAHLARKWDIDFHTTNMKDLVKIKVKVHFPSRALCERRQWAAACMYVVRSLVAPTRMKRTYDLLKQTLRPRVGKRVGWMHWHDLTCALAWALRKAAEEHVPEVSEIENLPMSNIKWHFHDRLMRPGTWLEYLARESHYSFVELTELVGKVNIEPMQLMRLASAVKIGGGEHVCSFLITLAAYDRERGNPGYLAATTQNRAENSRFHRRRTSG